MNVNGAISLDMPQFLEAVRKAVGSLAGAPYDITDADGLPHLVTVDEAPVQVADSFIRLTLTSCLPEVGCVEDTVAADGSMGTSAPYRASVTALIESSNPQEPMRVASVFSQWWTSKANRALLKDLGLVAIRPPINYKPSPYLDSETDMWISVCAIDLQIRFQRVEVHPTAKAKVAKTVRIDANIPLSIPAIEVSDA